MNARIMVLGCCLLLVSHAVIAVTMSSIGIPDLPLLPQQGMFRIDSAGISEVSSALFEGRGLQSKNDCPDSLEPLTATFKTLKRPGNPDDNEIILFEKSGEEDHYLWFLWLYVNKTRHLSKSELIRIFRQLSSEEKQQLLVALSLFHESLIDFLVLRVMLPAGGGESTGSYLKQRRPVQPHILRQLASLRKEAYMNEYIEREINKRRYRRNVPESQPWLSEPTDADRGKSKKRRSFPGKGNLKNSS